METLLYLIVTALALFVSGAFLYGLVGILKKRAGLARKAEETFFTRHYGNPVLRPSESDWETGAVMNPAAIAIGGRTHLFYRALGADGVSRIGYASSANGRDFDERLPYPVLALESDVPTASARRFATHAGLLTSGGSFAGVEDPRAVVIGDRVHLTFSAFASWDSLRMGMTSISISDLLNKRWTWTPPAYFSPKAQVHKNWVLFPQKIKGKFAILHSLHAGSRDRVLVDYLDTLDGDTTIHSPYRPSTDSTLWDSTLRGAGPPPMRTNEGWLLLYHATDAKEPSRYKVGALLLDLKDPTKVIGRSPVPVFAPDASYENDGAKAGVVYACGMTQNADTLRIYYGGSDSVVCTAETSLSRLLRRLIPVPAASLFPSTT